MNYEIVVIYCICDEVVKYFGIKDDPQCKMSCSELVTFALLSAKYFQCDYKRTRLIALNLKYFRKVLSCSQLIRRLHSIPEGVWMTVFYILRMYLHNTDCEYFVIDSFPVSAYQNHKSFRAKIFKGKPYHGYTASKKAYFFGLKIHMIVDENGIPIEFCITPGGTSDIEGLKLLPCELPADSILIGDKAYTNYSLEDDLLEMMGVSFLPKRRENLKRQHGGSLEFIHAKKRNIVETVFSVIVSKMPRQIKAKTEKGFYLKLIFFILAYSVDLYLARV
jgi:hypothetical protein